MLQSKIVLHFVIEVQVPDSLHRVDLSAWEKSISARKKYSKANERVRRAVSWTWENERI